MHDKPEDVDIIRNAKTQISKLEDEIDASEGLKALADTQGTKSLDDYLNSKIK